MALTPKELMAPRAIDDCLLKRIEDHIDAKLLEAEVSEGRLLSFCYEGVTPFPNEATVRALKQLYTKAGWRCVQVNTTHSIVTMECPRYRGATSRGSP